MIRSYRDLRVWQLGMELVEDIYRVTGRFPSAEVYGLTSQLRRAAISIPSNIAEGHTREHTKEFLHHLSTAQASMAEIETQIEIAVRLEYLSSEQSNALLEKAASLARQLHSLRKALRSK